MAGATERQVYLQEKLRWKSTRTQLFVAYVEKMSFIIYKAMSYWQGILLDFIFFMLSFLKVCYNCTFYWEPIGALFLLTYICNVFLIMICLMKNTESEIWVDDEA